MGKPKFLGRWGGSSETASERFRETMELAALLLLPTTAPAKMAGKWTAVQTVKGVQRIVGNPIGSMRALASGLNTYKRTATAVAAYTRFDKVRNYKSSGSSSRAYQQNGSPGGTSSLSEKAVAYGGLAYLGYKYATEDMYKLPLSSRRCRPGFVKKKIGGNWMCVRRHTRKR